MIQRTFYSWENIWLKYRRRKIKITGIFLVCEDTGGQGIVLYWILKMAFRVRTYIP